MTEGDRKNKLMDPNSRVHSVRILVEEIRDYHAGDKDYSIGKMRAGDSVSIDGTQKPVGEKKICNGEYKEVRVWLG